MASISNKHVTIEALKLAVKTEHNVPEDQITIENLIQIRGSKRGDGFLTDIVQANFDAIIDGQKFSKSYICKIVPDDFRLQMMKKSDVMEREFLCYKSLVPEMNGILVANGFKTIALPECFYADPNGNMLVMENLRDKNFQTVVKKPEPLTMDQIKCVLLELANWHAASYYLINHFPGGMEAFREKYKLMFTKHMFLTADRPLEAKANYDRVMKDMNKSTLEVFKAIGELDYAEKLKIFFDKGSTVIDDCVHKEGKLKTIIHGDAWFNNFMFRVNDGKMEIRVHDLQNTFCFRVGMELSYFMNCSLSYKQRQEHLESLLRLYHQQLTTVLSKLDLTLCQSLDLSFTDLQKEYDECFVFGFVLGLMHAQMLLVKDDSLSEFSIGDIADRKHASDMVEKLKEHQVEEAKVNPEYREVLLGLVREAAHRGII